MFPLVPLKKHPTTREKKPSGFLFPIWFPLQDVFGFLWSPILKTWKTASPNSEKPLPLQILAFSRRAALRAGAPGQRRSRPRSAAGRPPRWRPAPGRRPGPTKREGGGGGDRHNTHNTHATHTQHTQHRHTHTQHTHKNEKLSKYIYIYMVQRCQPPPPHQWSWVRQVPPPLWLWSCGWVVVV